MEQNIPTREAAAYEQIAKLNGQSNEAIKYITTSGGDVKLTVSAVADYNDINGAGGMTADRPLVFRVSPGTTLPGALEKQFEERRFVTASEAYDYGVKVLRAYADKLKELEALIGA